MSRPSVANHVFLGSWTVDIHQEGHSLRSAPQRRHTAHLRWCSPGWVWGAGNRAAGTGEVINMHSPYGTVHSPSTWSPELLRPGEGTKCMPNPEYSIQFSLSVVSNSLGPHELQHARLPCLSSTPIAYSNSGSLLKLVLVMPSNHLILCRPLLSQRQRGRLVTDRKSVV